MDRAHENVTGVIRVPRDYAGEGELGQLEEILSVGGHRLGQLRKFVPGRATVGGEFHFAAIRIGRNQMIWIVRIRTEDNISCDRNPERPEREESSGVGAFDHGLAGDIAGAEESETRSAIRK